MQHILSFLSTHHTEGWVVLGLVCIMAEMFMIPGLGLLFVGLGSLSLVLIEFIWPQIYELQYIALILLSLMWFVFLWKPMKYHLYRNKSTNSAVPNLIGGNVLVVKHAIEPGIMGHVEWSGVVMNAKLSENIKETYKAGSSLKVLEIRGNILICSPN